MNIACNLIRNFYSYLIPDSFMTVYFAHFQSLLQFEIFFWSSSTNLHRAIINQKGITRMVLGLTQRTTFTQQLKKLQIVTLPKLYILETVMFVVKCPDKYQTNVSNYSGDMRRINVLIYNL